MMSICSFSSGLCRIGWGGKSIFILGMEARECFDNDVSLYLHGDDVASLARFEFFNASLLFRIIFGVFSAFSSR
jgi:hypothetical protein